MSDIESEVESFRRHIEWTLAQAIVPSAEPTRFDLTNWRATVESNGMRVTSITAMPGSDEVVYSVSLPRITHSITLKDWKP